MAVTSREFGNAPDGTRITLYSIGNAGGFSASVMDFGAILVNLFVPDRDGRTADVVLGYDTADGYFTNPAFFGSTIGPSANRIDNAAFSIGGETYRLNANDGTNNLHSDDSKGYHKRMWKAQTGQDSVTFTLEDADGSIGFPGNKKVQVTYTVTEYNELKIEYNVTTDKPTLINMTNHSYFNLSGHNAGSIENHRLYIDAFYYTPVFERLIPTGDLVPVEGTPFDFRVMKAVGDDIDADDIQLKYGQGYDHNFAVDNYDGSIKKIAQVDDPASGRKMEVYTDQPGVQFYAGNCIPPHEGKQGAQYGRRSGLCLETQAFPDAVNQPQFQDVIYTPQRPYRTMTVYKFLN